MSRAKLTVLTGLGGSGKTTKARALAADGMLHFEGLEDNKAAIRNALLRGQDVVVCVNTDVDNNIQLDRMREIADVAIERLPGGGL